MYSLSQEPNAALGPLLSQLRADSAAGATLPEGAQPRNRVKEQV